MRNSRALKGTAKTLGFAIVTCVALFSASGTFNWPAGWAYIVLHLAGTTASVLFIDADLLAERSEIGEGVPILDIVLAIIMARLGPIAIVLAAGLEHRFCLETQIPFCLQILGIGLVLAGYAVALWALTTNRFFSGVVRIQADRGHAVVTHGPYALVRHPGYAGTILATIGAPLMLGSVWALVPAVMTSAIVIVRTSLEDRTLRRDLQGYEAYCRTVHFRLLPGLW